MISYLFSRIRRPDAVGVAYFVPQIPRSSGLWPMAAAGIESVTVHANTTRKVQCLKILWPVDGFMMEDLLTYRWIAERYVMGPCLSRRSWGAAGALKVIRHGICM
ncbi:MAG: hypothetical protein C4576_30385 [Desulfobacteraceae bacterium]|nr:MAG: hypothetical protein C4576_30385 [Desulfobacteraceae bacterium]